MYLVNSPESASFMELMNTETGRKVLLGDKGKFHKSALNAIGYAHNALADAIPKVVALASDPTRTTVDQHHAARQIAGKVATVLVQSQKSLEAASRDLAEEGNRIVADTFELDANRQTIHSEIRGWIREQAKHPDGIIKIREAAKTNSEVVTVLFGSPYFLLDLSEDTRGNIVLDGFKRFAPTGWTKIEQSRELAELAVKYPEAINKVHLYFYNPTIADQASRRVEV